MTAAFVFHVFAPVSDSFSAAQRHACMDLFGSLATLQNHPHVGEIIPPGVFFTDPEVKRSDISPHHSCVVVTIQLE